FFVLVCCCVRERSCRIAFFRIAPLLPLTLNWYYFFFHIHFIQFLKSMLCYFFCLPDDVDALHTLFCFFLSYIFIIFLVTSDSDICAIKEILCVLFASIDWFLALLQLDMYVIRFVV